MLRGGNINVVTVTAKMQITAEIIELRSVVDANDVHMVLAGQIYPERQMADPE